MSQTLSQVAAALGHQRIPFCVHYPSANTENWVITIEGPLVSSQITILAEFGAGVDTKGIFRMIGRGIS